MNHSQTYNILFVCMGNICRSPTGEAVLQHRVDRAGLSRSVFIDSAGTLGFHAGSPADSRMRDSASKRGYDLQSRSRQVKASDFDTFDLILAMDNDNYRDLKSLRPSQDCRATLKRFCDYCQESNVKEVPDPYYGGAQGFETVLDLIEEGCGQIMRALAR